MSDPLESLRAAASAREAAGMRRSLRPRDAVADVLDLASNDYLGLARDPRVTAAAADAALTWGAGSTGSRLVTGTTTLHTDLEQRLASFVGTSSALVFSSGYLANLGVVTALARVDRTSDTGSAPRSGTGSRSGPQTTLVVSDAQNHASLVDACRLARAELVVTPHLDVAAVADVLSSRQVERAIVVTDAVFSVDGDVAPLAELHVVTRKHGALLVVDEAHGLGVVGTRGRGAAAEVGIAGKSDVVLTVTLSKSLGSQGGAVLGDPVVIEHLVNTARAFIFDTGLAPSSVAAACAALAVLRDEPGLAVEVRTRALQLSERLGAAGLAVTRPSGAVVSVLVGDPGVALAAADSLRRQGVRVGCFRPPSVPDGISRLRLAARADLTDRDLDIAVDAIIRVLTR